MAALLLGPDKSLDQRDIETMLKKYALDDQKKTAVDVKKFRNEFQKMATQRNIAVGTYKPPMKSKDNKDKWDKSSG